MGTELNEGENTGTRIRGSESGVVLLLLIRILVG